MSYFFLSSAVKRGLAQVRIAPGCSKRSAGADSARSEARTASAPALKSAPVSSIPLGNHGDNRRCFISWRAA